MFWQKPDYDHMKFFGCLVYMRNTNTKWDKFKVRGRLGIFIGYLQGQKGHHVYDIKYRKFLCLGTLYSLKNEFPFNAQNLKEENTTR